MSCRRSLLVAVLFGASLAPAAVSARSQAPTPGAVLPEPPGAAALLGRWAIDSPAVAPRGQASTLEFRRAPAPANRQPHTNAAVPSWHIERHTASGSHTTGVCFGVQGRVSGGDPREARGWEQESASWVDGRLVLEHLSGRGLVDDAAHATSHEEVWWLDEEDHLHVRITDRTGDRPETRQTLVYRRLHAPGR